MLVYLSMIETAEDRSKFEQVYLHYKGLMYHVACQILNNREDAEDAVHAAFVKLAENIEKIDAPVCPKTQSYIVTITENKAIDLYRRKQRTGAVEYLDEISGVVPPMEDCQGLEDCILRLPARYRQVIVLKYVYGYTTKELGKLLKISEANAIKLDQRAKKKLLAICQEEGIAW